MHSFLEVTRKPPIVFIIILLLFSALIAQSKQFGAINTKDESFTGYFLKTLPENLLIGARGSFWGWNRATYKVESVWSYVINRPSPKYS